MSYKPLVGVNAAGGVAVNDADETAIDACSARVDFNPTASPWAATGVLGTARGLSPPLLLSDGTVLMAGGLDPYPAGPIGTAEVYNPRSRTWAATAGAMVGARGFQNMVLLPNGNGLVIGGFNGGAIATCELYNPSTGTFAGTGALNGVRFGHDSVLLRSGLVLSGGGENGGVLATCELYDPAAGTWAPTGAFNAARDGVQMVLLPSGYVLGIGGFDNLPGVGNAMATCELYNPTTGLWTATGSLTTARGYCSAVLLPNGTVLAAGGANTALNSVASCEIYNPTTGLWSATGAMGTARAGCSKPPVLPDGRIVMAGGSTTLLGAALATAEIYNPGTGLWAPLGNMVTARVGSGPVLLPSGQMLVAGGSAGLLGAAVANCELFSTPTPVLTTTSGVASVTTLGTGFYRLTLTAAALASWQAGGRHLYAEPASYAQPYDRSAQIQKAQVVRTDLTAGTIDVFVATEPVGINAAALPFNFWLR